MKQIILAITLLFSLAACNKKQETAEEALKPVIITEQTEHDTDDPAIWLNKEDLSKSLIVGTDKEVGGGIYLYDLQGKIVKKITGLQRPNNVDIAYGLDINGTPTDIAVVTERKANKIRIYSLPDLAEIDNGGIEVFTGEEERDPMGVSLYTKGNDIYAIVGRKSGPSGSYLWQYKLSGNANGKVTGEVVRKFGNYSGKKEIEAITVDNEAGYVYYSDETQGVRKYHADPEKGNEELAFFAQKDAKRDHEGLAVFKADSTNGYILLSNQQNNSVLVYTREGSNGNPHYHKLLADIPVTAIECDGLEVSALHFNEQFPEGILIMMSNGKVFHFYDWREVKARIK